MKTPIYGVSVKAGKFRANRIKYFAGGRSVVEPITGWTTAQSAYQAKRDAEAIARDEWRCCQCGMVGCKITGAH